MDIKVTTANRLKGTAKLPGDKSISHRALLIGALAEGESQIHGFLDAADPISTLNCLAQLGVDISKTGTSVNVYGRGLRALRAPAKTLDAGNSGTTIRLLSGILAGQPFSSSITGDGSLRKRPMKRIVDPLTKMGASISTAPSQTAPLTIQGSYPLRPLNFEMQYPSAQVKSCVLLAGLFADGITSVTEKTATRDHTERMLGLSRIEGQHGIKVMVEGGLRIPARVYQIPADISSAAFIIAAASIVPGSEVRILNVGLNPTRSRIIDLFRKLGASIEVARIEVVAGEPIGDLVVRSSDLHGDVSLESSDVAELIDEIPIIATTLAVSGLSLAVRGGTDLRNKETDRIKAIVTNLRGLGADVEEYSDGFAFQGKKTLIPAPCKSFGDHRIAMAFGVAGLGLKGETTIVDAECVDISFPTFWDLIGQLQTF
jgi:3-phosphoshikimate 1-carboxyvinyltransferase